MQHKKVESWGAVPGADPGAGFYQYSGGTIVDGRHYFDQMSWLTQIGVIPPPKQASAQ